MVLATIWAVSGESSGRERRGGKAARRRRQGKQKPGGPAARDRGAEAAGQEDDPGRRAQAAMARLVRGNPPGKVSLAGAYALGYGVLGLAQLEGEDQPAWFHDLDPLDTLFLGTVWPRQFKDGCEFANALAAWLKLLRGGVHWSAIERFVREVLAASAEHDLPVDEGELLLLAGRLEAAGLDQRKLPRALLPDTALAGTRLARGPEADAALPDTPPDAPDRVARLWAATEFGLPDDGTAVDALREGLHLLAAAGLDVRHDAAVLLPALYIGLVAGEYEDLAEAGERAAAWALGLDERSPLVPVTDVLLTAPGRGLDPDTALGHLFGIPAFTSPVRAEYRDWHSWPGTALTGLAFELGYTQVTTREGKVVRVDRDQAAALEAQRRQFEEKFGRSPGPDDPLFFDPDADHPQPVSLLRLEAATVGMLEAAGICPAWVYAYQHTGGLLPLPDGSFASARDQAEWDETISRYLKSQPGGKVDHQGETRKLRNIMISMTLAMAADDPGYGEALAAN